MKRTPLERKTPLRSRAPKRPAAAKLLPTRCELRLDGCQGAASHAHHRKLRSQGGSDMLANLIAVCANCHWEIHLSPRVAYDRGWLVRSWEDPAMVPVQRFTEAT